MNEINIKVYRQPKLFDFFCYFQWASFPNKNNKKMSNCSMG